MEGSSVLGEMLLESGRKAAPLCKEFYDRTLNWADNEPKQ